MPATPELEDMLRRAALHVTRPRVAVLAAVHGRPHADTFTIIGIVGDIKERRLSEQIEPVIYLPLLQHPARYVHLLVRTEAAPTSVAGVVQRALGGAEQAEIAFEHLRVALRERSRIRVLAALRAARQEQRAQLLVQRRAVLELRETERNGEERQDLGHVTALGSRQWRDCRR